MEGFKHEMLCSRKFGRFLLTNGTQYCPKSMSLKKLMKQGVEQLKNKLDNCEEIKLFLSWVLYKEDDVIKCYEVQYQEEVECKEATTATTYAVGEEIKRNLNRSSRNKSKLKLIT